MISREALIRYAAGQYGVDPDAPFAETPDTLVLRHPDSKKWFALMMYLPGRLIGLESDQPRSMLTLKCDPLLIGALLSEPGMYPAYHMNKSHWLSIDLDGPCTRETACQLLDLSYRLTDRRRNPRKSAGRDARGDRD